MIKDLNDDEVTSVFALAEALTGSCQKGEMRKEILVTNIRRRLAATGAANLEDYLLIADSDPAEFQELMSALTIHTTSWFREKPHFEVIEKAVAEWRKTKETGPFRVWCAACSTGEEVYSFASVLESIRLKQPDFEYEVLGTDIDPVSVDTARKGVYRNDGLRAVPVNLRSCFLQGSGRTAGLMTLSKTVRSRCRFDTHNLTKPESFRGETNFHFIVCRNVLIYFKAEDVKLIVKGLVGSLSKAHSYLCLGHSEPVEPKLFDIHSIGNCVYTTHDTLAKKITGQEKKSILVVDDTGTIRSLLKHVLERAGFDVVTVSSADEATEATRRVNFHAVTLDINMPVKDGLTWLKEQRKSGFRTPVIVLSDATPKEANTVLGAMREGAQEFVEKRTISQNPQAIILLIEAILAPKGIAKEVVHKRGFQDRVELYRPEAFVIGASTGGTEALTQLLANLPSDFPPVVVVQHISIAFSEAFAQRLARVSGLKLGDFVSGTPLNDGHIYLSTSDHHITLIRRGGALAIGVSDAAPMATHRPSADALFQSCAMARAKVVGVLLTGMGRDGARGLTDLKRRGMFTCCQDELSSVVFGMPKEAIQMGGATFIGHLSEIRRVLEDCARSSKTATIIDTVSPQSNMAKKKTA